MNSQYWQLAQLTSAGHCRCRLLPNVQAWFQHTFQEAFSTPSAPLADSIIQTQLVHLWRSGGADADLAQLSLRCYVSHQIRKACVQLARQFGHHFGFSAADLLPFVLDDEGRLDRPYRPFTLDVLSSYDATRAQLSTWAMRLTKNNKALNDFLLEHGLYRVSDWAILNDTSLSQLQRVLGEFHCCGAAEIASAQDLLERYHRVYRRDRLRQGLGSSRCATPTPEQLGQMETAPAQVTLGRLHQLAEQLRQYRIYVRSGNPLFGRNVISFDDARLVPEEIPHCPDPEETATAQFLQQCERDLETCLQAAVRQVLQDRLTLLNQRDPARAKACLRAICLFYGEQLTMGEIAARLTAQFAPHLSFKGQVQVTRLLQLKALRQQIRDRTLATLKQRIYSRAALPAQKQAEIAPTLDPLLAQKVDQIMAEAAAEAQSPHRQGPQSQLAQQLCQAAQSLGR